MRELAGYYLTDAEIDVARLLSARRWLAAAPNAWGSFCVLVTLARMGIASQCGRLFHVMPAADRIAAVREVSQPDLFA